MTILDQIYQGDGDRVRSINRMPLKSGSRITGKEKFHTEYGQNQSLTVEEKKLLREELLKQFHISKRDSKWNYIIIGIVLIIVLIIEACVISNFVIPSPSGATGINYTLADSGWTVLIWEIGIFILVTVAAAMVMEQRKTLKEAIRYGGVSLYHYEVQRKVVCGALDNETSDDYYIVIAGAYVSVPRSLYGHMHSGDVVRVSVINYGGESYFALLP